MEEKNHTKFIVISTPRSGSSYLCDLLDSNPYISCSSEIFHWGTDLPEKMDISPFEWFKKPDRGLRKYWEMQKKDGVQAYGFKIMEYQSSPVQSYLLQDSSVLKIVLERKNWKRHYYSISMANKTRFYGAKSFSRRLSDISRGIYHSFLLGNLVMFISYIKSLLITLKNRRIYTQGYKHEKIRLNTGKMLEYMMQRKNFIDQIKKHLESNSQKYFYLTYESLTSNDSIKICEEIQKFINVPVVDLTSSKRKLHDLSLDQLVINHRELDKFPDLL